MQDFEYGCAHTLGEVLCLLGSPGQSPPPLLLCGGTDLLVQLREGRKQAGLLVDIKGVSELNELSFDAQDGLTLGAALPCRRLTGDALLVKKYPGLLDAVALIGGTQVQSRASVGGNLCNASPAADSIPALIVHRARCVIASVEGGREMAVEDFCIAPGRSALLPGEVLVALRIPAPLPGFGAAYLRFIPRNEMDIAVVGAGASVVLDEAGERFVSARVALAAVAPTPLLVSEAGEFLAGRVVSESVIREAASIAQAAAKPISDMRGTAEQRRRLAQVLARRALNAAVERARITRN